MPGETFESILEDSMVEESAAELPRWHGTYTVHPQMRTSFLLEFPLPSSTLGGKMDRANLCTTVSPHMSLEILPLVGFNVVAPLE